MFKTQNCGINAHKHCKELVVMPCRQTSSATSRSDSFAAAEGSKVKPRVQRPWRRQLKSSQSDGDSSLIGMQGGDSCHCENGLVHKPPSSTFSTNELLCVCKLPQTPTSPKPLMTVENGPHKSLSKHPTL